MLEILYKMSYLLLIVYLLCLIVYGLIKKNINSVREKVIFRWVIVFLVITIFIIIMTILH